MTQPWYDFFDQLTEAFDGSDSLFSELVLIADPETAQKCREEYVIDFGFLDPNNKSSRLLLSKAGEWWVVAELLGYPFNESFYTIIERSDEYHIWHDYGAKRVLELVTGILQARNSSLETTIATLTRNREDLIGAQVYLNMITRDWLKEST